ncbi:MAG: hypothetical protein R6V03_03455 [Kiritimatiellia bacterium]
MMCSIALRTSAVPMPFERYFFSTARDWISTDGSVGAPISGRIFQETAPATAPSTSVTMNLSMF